MKTLLLTLLLSVSCFAQGSFYFPAFVPSNIKHPNFYKIDTPYGAGFVEYWVKVKAKNNLGYDVSDGDAGQHIILIGHSTDNDNAYLTGNFFTGTTFFNFGSGTGFKLNEWHHIAWGYNGAKVMLWLDGVKVFEAPYSGVRLTNAGGSDENLYVGGSHHNNPGSNIARIRIIEGVCPFTEDFVPDRVFSQIIRVRDGLTYKASFVADYSVNSEAFADLGAGLEELNGRGRPTTFSTHPGTLSGYTADTPLPEFQNDRVSYTAGTFDAPVIPEGALAFASFNLPNQTTTFQSNPTLGMSDGGSLGQLQWDAPSGWGILSGWAYCRYNSFYTNHLEIGRADVDVRVTRQLGSGTALDLRFTDNANHIIVSGSDTSVSAAIFENGNPTYLQFSAPPAGWANLRAIANGNTLTVYAGATQVGTAAIPSTLNGTKQGLYYGGSINRYKNFTVYAVN